MDVAPALLIEYTAPAAVVVWLWLRHDEPPRPLTVAGAGLAALGLVLVLDLLSGADLDPVGVLWALIAMTGAASYFVLGANQRPDLPPVALAGAGLAVGALGLAAVFSAEVSTCDAILFMLSTSLSKDLYKRVVNPAATDAQVLRVARIAAVAGGILGTLIAVQLSTIVTALTIFYSLVGVSLFVPVVAGLAGRRGGAPEALASIAAGIATLLAVHLATAGRGYGIFNPNLLGLIAAAIGFVLVYLARGRPVRVETV
jgi:Na+/proline symporter